MLLIDNFIFKISDYFLKFMNMCASTIIYSFSVTITLEITSTHIVNIFGRWLTVGFANLLNNLIVHLVELVLTSFVSFLLQN